MGHGGRWREHVESLGLVDDDIVPEHTRARRIPRRQLGILLLCFRRGMVRLDGRIQRQIMNDEDKRWHYANLAVLAIGLVMLCFLVVELIAEKCS
jgi:hypothetical protein